MRRGDERHSPPPLVRSAPFAFAGALLFLATLAGTWESRRRGFRMARAEKVDKVRELADRLRSADGAIFVDFRGLSVKDATELRRGLRDARTSFSVVKNTLTRLAAKEAGVQDAARLFEGPTAIAFIEGDAVGGAKSLLEMTRRFPALGVKGALIEGRVMGEEDARSLATIDTKDVSLAKVVGMLQAPLARVTYLLQAPLARIAFALGERGRQAE